MSKKTHCYYGNRNLFSFKNVKSRSRILFSLLLLALAGINPFTSNAQIDVNEFPIGYPTPTTSSVDQLKTFPLPRYKTGHTMMRNFNWMDPMYMGGRFQAGISDAQAITNSVDVQTELAKNFNYCLNVTWSNDVYNTAWKDLANANPQWDLGLITFRPQTNTTIWSQTLPSANYMQNSSGQFIGSNGAVVNSSSKVWRPTAPLSSYTQDGLNARSYISAALTGLTRNVNIVTENGEVFWIYDNAAMALDPVVTAAKNASGLDWETFESTKVKENDIQYRDAFMSLPQLSGARFSEYRADGHRDWNFRWEQSRLISTPINGHYYSTCDLYMRWPSNWQNWSGPWHGLKWVTQSRYWEILNGDKYFSPYIAAGYDANPELDVRPAQWLGTLKLLGMYGADFYYTAYFNEAASYMPPSPPPNDPKQYIWQAVMPSYAQGISSRYEDVLRNGSLLAGDMIDYSSGPTPVPFYQFNTGYSNKVVAIRKKDSGNVYAITGTIQNSSNVAGSTPLSSDVTITLNGQTLQFNIRRQGSTFIYDNTNTSAPVFYQLDGWHEASHPSRWTKDFNLEAELFDNTNASAVIKTSVPGGTAAGDFRNATSYVSFNAVSDLIYNIQPRGTSAVNYYLWVRARSKDGTSTAVNASMDGGTVKQMGCITNTNWDWYRFDITNTAVTYASLSLNPHQLKLTPSNTALEIDQVALTTNSTALYGSTPNPCGSSGTATITPSGATTFCSGGSVTLTANSGSAYLWSTGATSQSITVTTSGTFTVTVTTSGSPHVSSPVTVTVNPLPTATITPSGSLTINAGSTVTLTSSTGTAYLWSPGNQTTQSITVGTAGSYTVRVTNSSGCTKVSAAAVVIVNGGSCPIPTGLYTTNVTSNQATLHWTAVTGVDSLQVRLYNIYTGSVYLTGKFPGTYTNIVVGAASSTKYRWKIRSKCGSTLTAWSPGVVYTTPAQREGDNPDVNTDMMPLYLTEADESDFEDSDLRTGMTTSAEDIVQLAVYPNPTSGESTISFIASKKELSNIKLMDFTGKIIADNRIQFIEGINHYTIDLSKYSKGVYLVQVNIDGKSYSKKLIYN